MRVFRNNNFRWLSVVAVLLLSTYVKGKVVFNNNEFRSDNF